MRRAQQCRYFARSLPPNYRHSRLTIVRRGCWMCRNVGIHGEAMYTALTLRSACSSVDLLRRPQAAQSPNPPQRKQNSPAPGPKPGGGAGAEGRAAAAARRPKAAEASPPCLGCPQQDRRTGRRRRSGPGGANRHHSKKNGMAGACRRGRPPPLPRETAQQGHRGAQRNPAAGAQAFAPSGRRHLRSGGGGRG